MKSKLCALLLTLVIMLAPLISADIGAQKTYQPSSGFGGAQFYSVVFDAEGEAAVVVKLQFPNTGVSGLNEVVIEIPGQVKLINVVQEVNANQKVNNYFSSAKSYHSVGYNSDVLSTSTKYIFSLPVPVKSQETVTLLLYYKALGYVQNDIFDYSFHFNTIKQPLDLQQVRVAVLVQPDLYLKGGESKVNYLGGNSMFAAMEKSMDSGVSNPSLQQFSSQISHTAGYVKEAYALDPWESFTVNGVYSSSKLWLYKWNILGGLVIFAGLILLSAFGIRRIKSKLKKEVPFSGVLWGFGNSLVALAVGWFGFYLLEHLPRAFSYPLRNTVGIIIAFALVLLGFLLLLGFPVYLSLQRNDWRIGLMVFAITIFGLVVGGMILVVTMQM